VCPKPSIIRQSWWEEAKACPNPSAIRTELVKKSEGVIEPLHHSDKAKKKSKSSLNSECIQTGLGEKIKMLSECSLIQTAKDDKGICFKQRGAHKAFPSKINYYI
jgi:hypothetical protein